MQPTSVIFLNGASSSGKTTLGRALQRALDRPFFYLSSDQLVEANILPDVDRQAQQGERAWRIIRPRFFDGFHRSIAAFAGAGNPLIVEHVLEFKEWFEDCVQLLAPFDVFFVGVHCSLVELERRERERGNRTVGEGRSHLLDGVHSWGPYDIEVDTSAHTTEENTLTIRNAFANRTRLSSFQRIYAKQIKADTKTHRQRSAQQTAAASPSVDRQKVDGQ